MKSSFPSLAYSYTALEPAISAGTLQLHHLQHHRNHHDRAAELARGLPAAAAMTLEEIVVHAGRTDGTGALFHEASQAWSHGFYWQSMRPQGGGRPYGSIGEAIDAGFGSYPQFIRAYIGAALSVLGSGWLWLVWDHGSARLVTMGSAESPLLNDQVPLLALDLWEHAYYGDYQDRRVGYVRSFLTHLVNWEFASQRLIEEVMVAVAGEGPQMRQDRRPQGRRGPAPTRMRTV